MPGKCVRGAVVEVNLDPVVGSEANKTRPCVVIQNDVGNRFSPIVIVAAITGAENVPRKYPVDVPVQKGEGGLVKDSVVQCNQIRSVDEKRLVRTLGQLRPATMSKVDQALKISLAL
ncbi:MAG: type II toxin-antitoxin system PemK/MazF family toxin [Candidatus Binatus sp.]|uniref:type II toxin-antitoxin system PemK/MazF family toxin n=1 Tax=Candidatus Binatus sp. TaxID=2811406 RepID=UPI003C73B266